MKRVLSWTIFVAVVGAAWFVLGPTTIGGPASYVIVEGSSMEPTYADGALVITRQRSSYQVGDVVTYVAPVGSGFPVIHRIVGTQGDDFVTQGDNRAHPDGWVASTASIRGAAWLHIPHGGTLVRFLRQPATIMAVLAALVTLAWQERQERRRDRTEPGPAEARHDGRLPNTAGVPNAAQAAGSGRLVVPRTVVTLLAVNAALLATSVWIAQAGGLDVDAGVLDASVMEVDIVAEIEP